MKVTINPYGRGRTADLVEAPDEYDDSVKDAYEAALDSARVWAGQTDYFPAEWAE